MRIFLQLSNVFPLKCNRESLAESENFNFASLSGFEHFLEVQVYIEKLHLF